MVSEIPEFADVSIREFAEMRMLVSSRICGVEIEGNRTEIFVPYGDMFNHNRPSQTTWSYSNELKGFVVEATKEIKKGDQIYFSYGRKCNSRFLLNYGFCLENNTENEISFNVTMREDDPLLEQKKKLLGKTGKVPCFTLRFTSKLGDQISW